MANHKLGTALIIAAVTAAGAAFAQTTTYVRPSYTYPEPPPVGGPASVELFDTPFYVRPYIGLGVGHDDNLFLSHTNPKSSNLWVLSPGFTLDARDPNKVVQLAWQGQLGRYTSSPDDDYADQTARAQFDLSLDPHNFIRLGVDYVLGHEPRGSTDRPVAGRPDRYRLVTPSFMYALGAPGAIGRVELYADTNERHYVNNREFTASSDRDMPEFGGAFYFRVMPRTYVMAEARQTNIDYSSTSPFDGRERRYYAGVRWEATAATSGTVKVGRLERDFDDPSVPDYSGTSWEGVVSWAPLSYSKVDLYTARQTNEATGLGDFILTSIGGISWNHSWSTYVTTGVEARYQRDAYQGFDRTDKTTMVGLRAGYKFRRWLTLGAEYWHTNRDSNLDVFDYRKNTYFVTLTASL
jgi:hypothetical protein